AGIAQNLPTMHLGRGRKKAVALERGSISQVFWFQVVGLLEIVESLLVVLPRFGVLTFVIERLGGIDFLGKSGKLQAEQQQTEQSRTDQASHQAVLMKISLCTGPRRSCGDGRPRRGPRTARFSRAGVVGRPSRA